MKFISSLNDEQRQHLTRLMKTSTTFRVRQRAHAILLSAKGYSLDQLADIFEADRDTISSWLDCWKHSGVQGLHDAPKSGRPPKLTEEQLRKAIDQVKDSPRQITRTLADLKKTGPGDQP